MALYAPHNASENSANLRQIGQAMRVALGQGMHTDMPVDQLGDRIVERSRRIWWTVYVLDREMTSLMGLPQSVHDDDIHHHRGRFPAVYQ